MYYTYVYICSVFDSNHPSNGRFPVDHSIALVLGNALSPRPLPLLSFPPRPPWVGSWKAQKAGRTANSLALSMHRELPKPSDSEWVGTSLRGRTLVKPLQLRGASRESKCRHDHDHPNYCHHLLGKQLCQAASTLGSSRAAGQDDST